MYSETVDQIIIQAELTPEQAMELIRDIAAKGVEATGIRIEMRRYSDDDASLFISVNNGFGTMLKVNAAAAVISDEVNA